MAVAACIIGGIGGILYWQSYTGDWASWAYVWTLIPGFSGIGIIFDRQFGFLKETMVAPVPRLHIMLGKTFKVRETIHADEHGAALLVYKSGGIATVEDSWCAHLGESSVGVVGTKGTMLVGLDGVPKCGDKLAVCPDERQARALADERRVIRHGADNLTIR
jgi:hypothetical protein